MIESFIKKEMNEGDTVTCMKNTATVHKGGKIKISKIEGDKVFSEQLLPGGFIRIKDLETNFKFLKAIYLRNFYSFLTSPYFSVGKFLHFQNFFKRNYPNTPIADKHLSQKSETIKLLAGSNYYEVCDETLTLDRNKECCRAYIEINCDLDEKSHEGGNFEKCNMLFSKIKQGTISGMNIVYGTQGTKKYDDVPNIVPELLFIYSYGYYNISAEAIIDSEVVKCSFQIPVRYLSLRLMVDGVDTSIPLPEASPTGKILSKNVELKEKPKSRRSHDVYYAGDKPIPTTEKYNEIYGAIDSFKFDDGFTQKQLKEIKKKDDLSERMNRYINNNIKDENTYRVFIPTPTSTTLTSTNVPPYYDFTGRISDKNE